MLQAVALLTLSVLCRGKIVATLVESEKPEIASQFCFQTGKGTISIEAISTEENHRIAVLPLMSSEEVRDLMRGNACENAATEAKYLFNLSKPDILYFQVFRVVDKAAQCYSVVVLRCPEVGSINAGLYLEFSNSEVGYWDNALSMEEQGMLRLFLYALIVACVFLAVFWRFTEEMELQGVNLQLIVLAKTAYVSLASALAFWLSFYGLYAVTGMPSVLFKAMGCYSQWVFELAVLALFSLNATGYFLRDAGILPEATIVLLINAAVSLFLSMQKALESEDLLKFHWLWDSTWTIYARLVTIFILLLWSFNGFRQLSDDLRDKKSYFRMLTCGLLWGCAQPVGVLVTESLFARLRWKALHAAVTVAADLGVSGWLLTVMRPTRAVLLFSREAATQTLKGNKQRE